MKKFKKLAKEYLVRTRDHAGYARFLRNEIGVKEMYTLACKEIDLRFPLEERISVLSDSSFFHKDEFSISGLSHIPGIFETH